MASEWQEKRADFSEQFDANCYELARELIAIQRRELQELQKKPAGSLSVTAINKMALAARKSQELGRMALGETTDRKQLELNFGDMPIIEMVIREAVK